MPLAAPASQESQSVTLSDSIRLTPNTGAATQGRVTSIDALRGFDMFWIIGADGIFSAVNKLAGNSPMVRRFTDQLEHVQWAGLHFEDCIFPLFVFIVGVSIVFSLSKRVAQEGRRAAAIQIVRRCVILYLFGLFTYKGIADGWERVRLLGVLQRIAICYLCAGLAFIYFKPKSLAALAATLLLGYWAVMTFVPAPGGTAGNFAEGQNLANYIDREYLPLRKWDGDHDPEGILSTLPAIGGCILGVFAGMLLRRKDLTDRQKVRTLLICGAASLVLGLLWSLQFPIIKKIWTSSFVLVTTGISAMALALFYEIIDIRKKQAWATMFLWIGTNAITVYMFAHVVSLNDMAARIVGGPLRASLNGVHTGLGDFLQATLALGFSVLLCRFLYKRRIFLKV